MKGINETTLAQGLTSHQLASSRRVNWALIAVLLNVVIASVTFGAPYQAGIGLVITRVTTNLVIVGTVAGSPASREPKLQVGDRLIAAAEGTNRAAWILLSTKPVDEVTTLLSGPVGSYLTLKLVRNAVLAAKEYTITVQRTNLVGAAASISSGQTASMLPAEKEFADLLSGSKTEIVQPNYSAWEKIRVGMTGGEVKNVLGPPLEEHSNKWVYGWIEYRSDAFPERFEFEVFLIDGNVAVKEDPFSGAFSLDGYPSKVQLIIPLAGQVFAHYPRFVDLRWTPASGDYPMHYLLQLDVQTPSGWTSAEFQSETCYSCRVFSGSQRGRWRVRAINALGSGEWSAYRYFEFRK